MLQKGDVLKGKYEIQALIGKGGMSRVFRAADLTLNNKLWAVKEVDRRATDPSGRPIEQSLAREAEILSKLDHPKIVDIVDIEKTKDFIYVVMDYVEGESLDKVVRREGPQSEENVQKWMLEICDALGYLHRQNPQIVYRDMKPNNIMLHPDGYVKLIDLGVAREYKDEARKDTVAFGTTGYAAPEQYGTAQTDARTDIYGIGATMWHLLAGEAPPVQFPLPDVREVEPSVGEGFADVIIPKCTKLESSQRYQSCEELSADLQIYQELTREYRAKQVNKVKKFAVTGILSVVMFIMGFVLLAVNESNIASTYEQLRSQADSELGHDVEQARALYVQAIEQSGRAGADVDTTSAYFGLLNCYEDDRVLTEEEKKEFDSLYRGNLETLSQSDDFGALSLEAGQVHWLFYAYGENRSSSEMAQLSDQERAELVGADAMATRIKAASDYFTKAVEFAESGVNASWAVGEEANHARMFKQIADFAQNIEVDDQKVSSGSSSQGDPYLTQWASLIDLVTWAGDERTDDLMKLNSYALIVNGIETYADEFRSSGVSKAEMNEVLGSVKLGIDSIIPKASQVDQHEALQARYAAASRKFETIYANDGVLPGGNLASDLNAIASTNGSKEM